MSDLSGSGSSGLSEGWTLVSKLGEVEDSDGDSSSSSIEVVQQNPDPASQCSSVESTELEQLMKKADAAAAAIVEMKETELSESVSSGIAATPDGSVDDQQSPPLSALEELSGIGRSELTGEEEAETRTIPSQPTPERASFSHRGSHTDGASYTDKASDTERASQVDQASQTDQASSVLSDRRFSLSSLWSFSLKSSNADTTSDSDASSATSSTDADTEEGGSSIDTDTDVEPEFVCLETEATNTCPPFREGSMLRSKVEAIPDDSKSSIGSEFVFLPGNEDFAPTSVNDDLELLPLADQEHTVQQDHHHHQSYPESLTPAVLLSYEEQQQPSVYHCQEQGKAVSQLADNLHHQKANTNAQDIWPRLGRHHSPSYFRRWLGRPVSLAVGMFLMVFLAFGLGHWTGTVWTVQNKHSRQLWKVQNEYRQCLSEYHHLHQQADAALKREKKKHQETVTDLRHQQQQLSKCLKEAEQHVEQFMTASSLQFQDSAEGQKGDKRPGPTSENSEDQKRSDLWYHLYFSMRDERDIKMNGSKYLHYFTRRVNASALFNYLMQYWNVSRSWTENVMADLSSGLTGLQENVSETVPLVWRRVSSRIQENVAETVPSMWKAVSSSLSNTYHAFASSFYQSADSQHGKAGTKQKRKTGEDRGTEESDEEVYVENEEEFYSQEYNNWEGEKKEHDAGTGVWTEEEDENIDIDNIQQMRTEYEEETKAEDETQDGNKHRKKWSGIMNRLLKKTKKVLSRVGKQLQKTWHKVKGTSQQLWSEDSAPRRMAEKVKDSISKLSSKLQKKAQRWFRKHFKEKKQSEAFQKHEKKETHASNKQDGKKSEEHITSDKLRKNEKNKQKFDYSNEDWNDKDKSEKETRGRKVERRSDKFVKANTNESIPQKIIKDQKKDHLGNLAKEKKKGRAEKEQNGEKERDTARELDRNGKNGKTMGKSSKLGKETVRKDSSKKQDERDRKRKLDEMNNHNIKKKGRSDTLSKIQKERSDKTSDVGKKGEDFPAHHHSLSNTAVARTKFRLQSQFQELFSKVGSMNTASFRKWSNREVSKMVDDVLTFAKRYNSKLHLGLPVSGSQWLRCQHAFWVSALSYHGDFELIQDCFQFLAPWQTTLLEEEGAENFPLEETQEESIWTEKESDGEDRNFLTHEDHDNMDIVDFSVDDVDDDFADDCHINSDANAADESDHRTKDCLASKGQREEDENTNTLTSAQNSQQSLRKTNSEWYVHRAKGQNNLRSEDHKADWMFERAKERDEARQKQHKADWMFERAAERDANRHQNKQSSQSRRKPEPERNSHSHDGRHDQNGKNRFKHEERGYRQKYGRASFCLFC